MINNGFLDLEPVYCGQWGVSSGMSVAVGDGDRWKVTCDTLHVACDM